MATRDSVDNFIHKAEDALNYATKEVTEARKNEHYNQTEYSKAQIKLEAAHNDLDDLQNSANSEQKERIYRMQLQLRAMQNEMVLDEQEIVID